MRNYYDSANYEKKYIIQEIRKKKKEKKRNKVSFNSIRLKSIRLKN